jgi:hypothetical protein
MTTREHRDFDNDYPAHGLNERECWLLFGMFAAFVALLVRYR